MIRKWQRYNVDDVKSNNQYNMSKFTGIRTQKIKSISMYGSPIPYSYADSVGKILKYEIIQVTSHNE